MEADGVDSTLLPAGKSTLTLPLIQCEDAQVEAHSGLQGLFSLSCVLFTSEDFTGRNKDPSASSLGPKQKCPKSGNRGTNGPANADAVESVWCWFLL